MSTESSAPSLTSTYSPTALTDEALVDDLVDAVLDTDIHRTIKMMREAHRRGLSELVNSRHSVSGVTPLVAAGVQEPSIAASLIVRFLRLAGASLPAAMASSAWLSAVQPWAFREIDGQYSSRDGELGALLAMSDEEATSWIRRACFSPSSPVHARESTATPPVKHVAFDPVIVKSEPEVIDLTNEPNSRSPTPVPKEEDDERTAFGDWHPGANDSPSPSAPLARAHLGVKRIPASFTEEDLRAQFDGLPGVLGVELHAAKSGARFGLVAFASYAAASRAHAAKEGTHIMGEEGPVALSFVLLSTEGPAPNPFETGERSFRHLPAAELRRRLYIGNLRVGISGEEVVAIFASPRVGVQGRLKKLGRTRDHAWGIFVAADARAAERAASALHGTHYDGHSLQVEPVNELFHERGYVLTVEGFPSEWGYQDVTDFLICKINSFASVVIRSLRYNAMCRMVRTVEVEMRYLCELEWVRSCLHGVPVNGVPLYVTAQSAPGKRSYDGDERAELERGRKRARDQSHRAPTQPPVLPRAPAALYSPPMRPALLAPPRATEGRPLGTYAPSTASPGPSVVDGNGGTSVSPNPYVAMYGPTSPAETLVEAFTSGMALRT